MRRGLLLLAMFILLGRVDAMAQAHAGQMDTDGILSPGEVRNPNIDYDRVQRRGEWHGDSRFSNPDNDSAAAHDRYVKDRADDRYWRDHHRDDYRDDYYSRNRYRDRDSWWHDW